MVLLFIVLVLMTAFPLNYQIIQNSGFKGLNAVTYELRTGNTQWLPDELPSGFYVSSAGMQPLDRTYTYTTSVGDKTYTIILNPLEDIAGAANTIVLMPNKVMFFDGKGTKIEGTYNHLTAPVTYANLVTMDKGEAVNEFFSIVDGAFSEYLIFYSVVVNTGIQYLMNLLFVFVLALILLMVRINYKKVTTFGDNINIIIASMVIPSLVSFVIGLTGIYQLSTFTVVTFQLFTPLIALGAIYKGGKEREISVRSYK
jgi:maltodextrin utilization protein YvdJ